MHAWIEKASSTAILNEKCSTLVSQAWKIYVTMMISQNNTSKAENIPIRNHGNRKNTW